MSRMGDAAPAAVVGEDDDDDEGLADFLEFHLLSTPSADGVGETSGVCEEDAELTEPPPMVKTGSLEKKDGEGHDENKRKKRRRLAMVETQSAGYFSRIPADLFPHIFKFLSSEDLISCSLVCRFMNLAASDETLWRRLYCMRWGSSTLTGKFRASAWKKLYIQRDREDMVEFVRNTPPEFKEYYIQMQAAKRSQAPLPSQVKDDRVVLDKSVADQVSIWKRGKGFTDDTIIGHNCSGKTCTYSHIGDVFVCEKTGFAHVCDDTCREAVVDNSSGLLVCTISGQCFEGWVSEDDDSDVDQTQAGGTDEAEPSLGSGRFARAYLLGYNCADEKELEAALRFC